MVNHVFSTSPQDMTSQKCDWSISVMILEELQYRDIRLCLLKCLHTFFVSVDIKQASHTVLIYGLFEVLAGGWSHASRFPLFPVFVLS